MVASGAVSTTWPEGSTATETVARRALRRIKYGIWVVPHWIPDHSIAIIERAASS